MVAKKKLNKKKVITKNKSKPQDLSFQEVIFKLQKFQILIQRTPNKKSNK